MRRLTQIPEKYVLPYYPQTCDSLGINTVKKEEKSLDILNILGLKISLRLHHSWQPWGQQGYSQSSMIILTIISSILWSNKLLQ